jgi:predicted DNA-binding protein
MPAPPVPAAARTGGTRATQARLPPALADWLSHEAHRSGRTLASVIALAAQTHRQELPLARRNDSDQLDVSRRIARATTPVTLRLNGAQRELLDELASQHTTTRSAIVVAALTAATANSGD